MPERGKVQKVPPQLEIFRGRRISTGSPGLCGVTETDEDGKARIVPTRNQRDRS